MRFLHACAAAICVPPPEYSQSTFVHATARYHHRQAGPLGTRRRWPARELEESSEDLSMHDRQINIERRQFMMQNTSSREDEGDELLKLLPTPPTTAGRMLASTSGFESELEIVDVGPW